MRESLGLSAVGVRKITERADSDPVFRVELQYATEGNGCLVKFAQIQQHAAKNDLCTGIIGVTGNPVFKYPARAVQLACFSVRLGQVRENTATGVISVQRFELGYFLATRFRHRLLAPTISGRSGAN